MRAGLRVRNVVAKVSPIGCVSAGLKTCLDKEV